MPTIISPAVFKAEISIAQTENPYQSGNVQEFIDKYEPIFIKKLLGQDLAKLFIEGLSNLPDLEEKWIALRDETDLKSMIAKFVYYWYKRYETTQSMGISEAKPKGENVTTTNSVNKQVNAWNDMVGMVRLFDLDVAIYPEWKRPHYRSYRFWYSGCGVSELYFTINENNI